ncbi:MAG: hypothetical protein CO094_09415 [Anaerolineae bacterium CG_4_9_14_3_um_filter_57_17]|nr:hypothetical protein [bacterium]NCT21165.1 hypothetical protein [bacterium]OIO86841.1 MAG: hypothetical protein AUK01_01780 [Anaerolineae bacterium CG2_30_57_67]PJB65650.1 MAG: hypothetical protein CO094_09415 [Anaerolineae bacterium CG_4_9_14_3_um_filter_57_17]
MRLFDQEKPGWPKNFVGFQPTPELTSVMALKIASKMSRVKTTSKGLLVRKDFIFQLLNRTSRSQKGFNHEGHEGKQRKTIKKICASLWLIFLLFVQGFSF